MKKTLQYIFFALLYLCILSCSKSEPQIILNEEMTFNGIGGSQLTSFVADGKWTSSSNATWCQICPSEGTASDQVVVVSVVCEKNISSEKRSCIVELRYNNTTKTINVTQGNNIYKEYDYITPLELKPHVAVYPSLYGYKIFDFGDYSEFEYESSSKDGKRTRDYKDHMNINWFKEQDFTGGEYEYVSAAGTELEYTGGDVFHITEFTTDQIDSVYIGKANVTCESKWYNRFYWEGYHSTKPDEVSGLKAAEAKDGKWSIFSEGTTRCMGIHKLIASTSSGDVSQSITIYQHENYFNTTQATFSEDKPAIFTGNFTYYTERDEYPEYEDYPPGSDPAWGIKPPGIGWFWNKRDSKSLHPDNNRIVPIRFHPEVLVTLGRKYTTGEVEWIQALDDIDALRGGLTVIASATIKLSSGATKDISKKFEWIETKESQRDTTTGWSSWKGYNNKIHIKMPVISEACKDFEWTFTLDDYSIRTDIQKIGILYGFGTFKDMDTGISVGGYRLQKQPLKNTNINEINWGHPSFKLEDRKSLFSDWLKAKEKIGWPEGSKFADNEESDWVPNLFPDYIDGVPQTYNTSNKAICTSPDNGNKHSSNNILKHSGMDIPPYPQLLDCQ